MRDVALRRLPRAVIFLAVLFTLLNMADYALTYYAVSTGMAREANPLLSWVPLWNIGLVKAVLGVWIVYRVHNKPSLLILVSVVMALVVAWNTYCLTLPSSQEQGFSGYAQAICLTLSPDGSARPEGV